MGSAKGKHMAIIYGLRDKHSNLYFYIGSTKYTADERWEEHQAYVRGGYNKNFHFVNVLNKIGMENVRVDVLHECSSDERFNREYRILALYRALGHPLTNIVYADDEHAFTDHADYYRNYPLRPDHFLTAVDVYLVDMPRNGNTLHDMMCDEIEAISKCLIDKHFDGFMEMFRTAITGIDDEQETNRQAISLYKRLSETLERNKSRIGGGLF